MCHNNPCPRGNRDLKDMIVFRIGKKWTPQKINLLMVAYYT